MTENDSTYKLTLDRAHSAVLSHDYTLAARLYKNLLREDSQNEELLYALGDLYQRSGNDSQAIPLYNQIVNANPSDVKALNCLGSIYRRLKRYDESISVLEKAVVADESNVQTFYNLGFTYKLMGKNKDAIQCFNTVVEENSNDVLAYNHLGSIYAEEKDFEKSIASYQRGLKVDPNHPILHLNLAKCYEKQGAEEFAEKEYEAALRSKPGWLDAIDGYADLLLKKNHGRLASDLLAQAVRLNPNNAAVHEKMGDAYSIQSDFDNAEDEYIEAIRINPESTSAISSLASVYEKNGKVQEAIRAMQKYEELSPNNSAMLKQYADILLSADKVNIAKKKIKEVWDLNPDDVQTLNLLGQYYICCGLEAKAEGCFKRIREIDPLYNEYVIDSARRYHQKGQFEKAETNIKRYLETNSPSSRASNLLAENYEKLSRYQEALDQYKQLADIDMENKLYQRGIERVTLKMEEIAQNEDYNSSASSGNGVGGAVHEEGMRLPEAKLISVDDDIEPRIDFSDMNQRLSAEDMVRHSNRGFTFENLTHEDNSGGSPFDRRLDDELQASNSTDTSFDNLIPASDSILDDEDFFGQTGQTVSAAPGAPVESLMDSSFMEEDVKGTAKTTPSQTMELSDGWDEPEDEDPAPARKPAPPKPSQKSEETKKKAEEEDFSADDDFDFKSSPLYTPPAEDSDETDVLEDDYGFETSMPEPGIESTSEDDDTLVLESSDETVESSGPEDVFAEEDSSEEDVFSADETEISSLDDDDEDDVVFVDSAEEIESDDSAESTDEDFVFDEETEPSGEENETEISNVDLFSEDEPVADEEPFEGADPDTEENPFAAVMPEVEENTEEEETASEEEQPASDSSFEEEPLQLSADLFLKLKDLSTYLPLDKKTAFLESKVNLQLEYLIRKCSGVFGLLKEAQKIRDNLNLNDVDVDISNEAVRNMLVYIKTLLPSLPDRNIALSLQEEIDITIQKLLG